MTQDDFRDVLHPHLKQLFAPLGFTRRGAEGSVVRRAGEVTQSIEAPVAVFGPEVRFSLTFGFRAADAERLYNQFSGIKPKYQSESLTCVVGLEAIAPEVPRQGVVVSDDRPLSDAVSWLAPILARDVFPFLDAHRTLHGLSELLNGDQDRRFDRTMEPDRAMHGVVLAYLTRTPDWLALATAYRSRLTDAVGEEELARFDQLTEYLRRQ
jgi:hypothetical protein